MRKLLACVVTVGLLIPLVAHGAVITSARSGNWASPSTWTGGSVPGAGDSAVLSHYIVVNNGTDITATVGVTLLSDATLIIKGATTSDAPINLSAASAELVVNRAAILTMDTTTSPAFSVANGTANIYGQVIMGASSEGAANREVFDVQANGTLNLQGRTIGRRLVVASVPLTSQTTSDQLVLTMSGRVHSRATHAIVTNGHFRNMIWPIVSVDGNTLTLDGPLLQAYNANATVTTADSARDSIIVDDGTVQPAELGVTGASVIINDGEEAGQIERVFPNSQAGDTAFFVDRTIDKTGWDASEPYVLTWGIAAGTSLTFMQAARVWAADAAPAVDTSRNGDSATGKTQCRIAIDSSGTVDIDYAAVRWAGGSSGVLHPITLGAASDVDYLLMFEPASPYNFCVDASVTVTVDRSAFYKALGPMNGDFGHWFRAQDASNASVITITDCTAIGTLDDYFFQNNGGTTTITRARWADWGLGNFFDNNSVTTTLNAADNYVWGSGQTAFQLDEGTYTATITGGEIVNPGSWIGQTAVDPLADMDGGITNARAFNFAGTATSLTVDGVVVRWPQWEALNISAATTDTARFNDLVFRNYAIYTEPDSNAYPAASSITPGAATISGGGQVVLDGCRFHDPYRRGANASVFTNTRANLGMQIRGSGGTLYADVRRCYFNEEQSVAEGITTGSTQGYIYSEDPDWVAGGIAWCFFDGVKVAFRMAATGHARVPIHHNLFLGADSATGSYIIRTSGADLAFNYNTFVLYNTGQYGIEVNTTSTADFFGNLFLTNEGTAESVRWAVDAQANLSDVTYNYWAISHTDVVQVVGSPLVDMTVSEAEARYATWANNGSSTGSSTAWESVVTRLTMPRLLSTSAAKDFTTDTDLDGTSGDCGYIPLLAKDPTGEMPPVWVTRRGR